MQASSIAGCQIAKWKFRVSQEDRFLPILVTSYTELGDLPRAEACRKILMNPAGKWLRINWISDKFHFRHRLIIFLFEVIADKILFLSPISN